MKKKLWKKVLMCTFAGVLMFNMEACGTSANQSSNNKNSQNDVTSVDNDESKPTITFMTQAIHGTELANEYSDQVIEAYEKFTGINVEWNFVAKDTYTEMLGLTLMDKDKMPMVLMFNGEMPANVIDAAQKGAFWDLTEYLQDLERFPNLSQYNETIIESMRIDNQIIAIYRGRVIGRNGLSYRKDWAEAVGITEDPKTIDDVYEMLWKFTYEDPDGNGKDDTYGMEMTSWTAPFDIYMTWFGAGNSWTEVDGKLVPVHQTEEYIEAINWLKKCYEDGLIRPDFAAVTTTYGDATKKGESGVFVSTMDDARRIWDYFVDNHIESVVDSSETAEMVIVGPINERTLATSGHNGGFLITKDGAKTEEDLFNCLTYLDRMCEDEMLILADYGLEGITYEIDSDGNIVLIEGWEDSDKPNSGMDQSIAYIPNIEAISPQLSKDERRLAQDTAYEQSEAVAVFNVAAGYLANSEVNGEVGTDIRQIIDDARTQYICGQIDEAGLQNAMQVWLDRGGDRLIEEINQLAGN